MFGSLLINSSPGERASVSASEGIQKCLDSAKQTIDIIYHIYQHHDFFRTWYVCYTWKLKKSDISIGPLILNSTDAVSGFTILPTYRLPRPSS